jgi:hypothetical protein
VMIKVVAWRATSRAAPAAQEALGFTFEVVPEPVGTQTQTPQ